MTDHANPLDQPESSLAWRELLDGMRDLDQTFLTGDRSVVDEQSVAEGYRFLATVLGVAFDLYLFSDRGRPQFIDINAPFTRQRRWGGDNTDAYYSFATIDPTRTYRVSGQRGDSLYFSATIYNEPAPGQWSDRIIGTVNDTDLELDNDGRFSFVLGPAAPDGAPQPQVILTADSAVVLTRDYQLDPSTGRRTVWAIEALDPPSWTAHTDADTATSLRSVLTWARTMTTIAPLSLAARDDNTEQGHNSPDSVNGLAEPYRIADANYGWSAGDACYSFGSFSLQPDEALVITHRPPVCRFWSAMVWNPFMACFDTSYDRSSVNQGSSVRNADGTVTVVLARERLAHPNAISTVGHQAGAIALRWFLAEEVPARPTVELVNIVDAPTTVS
jgi:hypothetical protein